MSSETTETAISKTGKSKDSRRDKRIQNVKTFGDLTMYVGSAGLMIPMIRNARENQNKLMGLCATGAGAIISVGLGNLASKLLNKTVDKAVDFWDEVKPAPATTKQEDEEDG